MTNSKEHTTTNSSAAGIQRKPRQSLSEMDREWLAAFRRYMQQHACDANLLIPAVAQHCAMSESTLLRQVKRLTGLSPVQYLQEVRLKRARRLLEERVYKSIGRVAAEVGYRDTRSLSRLFKRKFGKLPSEW